MLLDYVSYFIFCCTLVGLSVYLYIKTYYGFWASQPVFHTYDILYKMRPPGIIQSQFSKNQNKYINCINITTTPLLSLSSLQKQKFIHFIQKNYRWKNHKHLLSLKEENIWPYLTSKSYVSLFHKDVHFVDAKTREIIDDTEIIGSISSKPMTVTIYKTIGSREPASFSVYWTDFVCIDPSHKNKGVWYQLLSTHLYHLPTFQPHIHVSLFKREGKTNLLPGVVPLCIYDCYGFHVTKWTQPPKLAANYTVLQINPQNFRFLYDFIKTNQTQFDIVAEIDVSNLLELIKTNNIFIYCVIVDTQVQCCYFFKKTNIHIEKGLEALSCFASICHCDESIFIHGYKISFWEISYKHYFGFALIENISHNHIILQNILQKSTPSICDSNAYYFYNFAYPSFTPGRCLILL